MLAVEPVLLLGFFVFAMSEFASGIPVKLNQTKTRIVYHHNPDFLKSLPSHFSCAVHITKNVTTKPPNDSRGQRAPVGTLVCFRKN